MLRVRTVTAKGAFITAVILLVLTLLFAVLSGYLIVRGRDRKNNCTEKTDAVVMDIVKRKGAGRSNRTKYYPVVVYKVGKKKYERELEIGDKDPDDHEIGDIIEIFYDPDDPEKACTEQERRSDNFSGGMLTAFTVVMLIAAIKYLYQSRKIKQAAAQTMQVGGYGSELDEMNR